MTRLHALLQWLRIEDEDGVLSFTFLMFALVSYLLIAGKPVSLTEMGAFLGVLVSYGHKRHIEAKKDLAGVNDASAPPATEQKPGA
jgi:hypothetical protein